ncbi:glutamate--cysteine ligase [Actinomadura sp. DC4]|uniref:carboxylate-amine ligase n=1 Tax=Actinomadura sp. DC4 TaxID=3055069 RepID=UPI0025AF7EB5|nr:glutamate--cysteine ligase [Actinomadura sp. DC4]MDN3359880.1 glutamate--cysteine ligase [Actinomadura sp. DC4]
MTPEHAPDRPRFGVEEEFWVVDATTRHTVPRAGAVIRRAGPLLGDRVGGEITEMQVETRTRPCHTLDDLHDQLREARTLLAAAAAEEGLRIAGGGTPVLGPMIPSPITQGPRQDLGNATFRGLHHELGMNAVHVHVEVPERERALMVSNHLRPYLPTLIALTATSPYWDERDTGYASWRTLLWQRWPVAGPPPYFTSEAHYEELIASFEAAGAIVDVGTVFWDIRPSSRLPTLEVRVADMPITAEESALLAALVRALVVTVLPLVDAGDRGPVVSPETMRLAYWRAARDGLGGDGIDPRTGRPAPSATLARRLLETVRPALGGDAGRVAAWLDGLVEDGDGATRQRRARERQGGLAGVVDHVVAHTAPAVPQESTSQ